MYVDATSSDTYEVSQIFKGESIGVLPDSKTLLADYWSFYPVTEVSHGVNNVVPAINSYFPYSGETLDSETFIITWNTDL